MPATILVPLDGSDLAAQALPFAAWLARAQDARLLLLRAPVDVNETNVPHGELLIKIKGQELLDRLQAMSELADVAEALRQDGIAVETCVRSGDAAQMIVETARSHQASLIVMSTHGRGGLGRWLYGSVADQVLRQTTLPVVLVPPACERRWPDDRPLRLLLTLDGSPLAEGALGPTGALAGPLGAALLLLRVVEQAPPRTRVHAPRLPEGHLKTELTEAQTYLEGVANGLRTAVHRITVHATIGDAAQAITTIARAQDVDLIAMATHGRGGLARLVLGSVATETLQQASVPLLLIRPPTLGAGTE